MNRNIKHLFRISDRKSRLIIGLMSGTSFDGLDIAMCRFYSSGLQTKVELLNFHTISFDEAFKEDIKSVFIKETVSLLKVSLLNESIGSYFGELVLQSLKQWGVHARAIDLVASHGQTIFHAPSSQHRLQGRPNATLQIGDGDHLAVKTGIITLSDFRQKHIAAGGEGAPLAVYGDFILFSKKGENRIMLNIGGIANFTYLPSGCDASEVFSTDVGPGNTLMDQFIQLHFPGKYYDRDAVVAISGKVNVVLLETLLSHPFFDLDFPKTTGPELFNMEYLNDALSKCPDTLVIVEDVMATLCRFSAMTIVAGIKACFAAHDQPVIYLSGGGMYNPLLVEYLKANLGFAKFESTAALGIHPDAKEAVLFAVLANEAVSGKAFDFGATHGIPGTCMGKISFP